MGWADCGKDSRGRRIGYAISARCDEPGCHARIDRGLSYACGGEHGETSFSCGGYFCGKHLFASARKPLRFLCQRCLLPASRRSGQKKGAR